MIFPLKIQLPLLRHLLLIDSVYSMLLDVDIWIVIILPKCDEVRIGAYLCPFVLIEVLPAGLLVSHL